MASNAPGFSKPFPGPGAPAGYYNLEGVGQRYYTEDGKWRFGSPESSGQVTIPGENLVPAFNQWVGQWGLGTSQRATDTVNSWTKTGYGTRSENSTSTKGKTDELIAADNKKYGDSWPAWNTKQDKETPTSTSRSTSTSTSTPAPTRTPEPLAKTLDEAYKSLGPRAVGDMTWGRVIGRPNPTGFIDVDTDQPGAMWNTEIDTSVLPEYDKSAYSSMDVNPDIYNSSEVLPAGVGFNDVDLNTGLYDTVLPQSQPMTGLQALRADEKSKGLVYASGKYWAENADGKLEAIPTDLVNGEGTARQQAIAFMESRKQPIIEAVQKNSQVNESVMTPTSESPSPQLKGFTGVSGTRLDGTAKTAQEIDNEIELRQQALEEQLITRAIQEEAPLWGPTDETGPVVTSTPTQTTPQMPSIPFGDIPEGFQGIRLPGALLDTGRGFAEEIGGELGRRKAMEKGGNLPFIGGIILDYGEKKGQEQGRETFDKYAKPFEPFFKQ